MEGCQGDLDDVKLTLERFGGGYRMPLGLL